MDQPETLARWGMAYTALFTALFYPAANAALGSGWSGLELAAMIAGSIVMTYPAGRVAWWVARALEGRPSARPASVSTMPAEITR